MTYAARAGNVTELAAGQSLATAGQDFSSTPLTVTLQDGQQSAVISVDVLEVRTYVLNTPFGYVAIQIS